MYKKQFVAGWGDMDFNAHMANIAYLNKAADTRMMFFADHGFPMSEFVRLRIGPIVMEDSVAYFSEFRLLDTMTVTLALAGISDDGSRFMFRNEFFKGDEKVAARVTTTGAWLDMDRRKLRAPSESLLAALKQLSQTADFQQMSSGVR